MTTEAGLRRTIRGLLLALPVALVAWIAVLALVLRAGGEAPAAFVPFPSETLLAALPADVTVTAGSAVSVTLRGDAPDLVARLYAAGAWLVLPAGLEACVPSFLERQV